MWIRTTFLGDKQFLITPFVTRLLNVELQELLFGHDNFLFCKVDGLHYEINMQLPWSSWKAYSCMSFQKWTWSHTITYTIPIQMSIILKVNIITKSKCNILLQKFKVGRRKKSKSVLNLSEQIAFYWLNLRKDWNLAFTWNFWMQTPIFEMQPAMMIIIENTEFGILIVIFFKSCFKMFNPLSAIVWHSTE
jgi:hypothetical protein